MRLTFTLLFACWTIYSSSISVVLSLPPSLIASAASLQHQQKKSVNSFSNELFDKDVALRDEYNKSGNISANKISNVQKTTLNTVTNKAHKRKSRMAEIASGAAIDPPSSASNQAGDPTYDLNGFLQAYDDTSDTIYDGGGKASSLLLQATPPMPLPLQTKQENIARADSSEFFTPLKFWAKHCQPGKNCPKQYYRAHFINRNINNEAPLITHPNGLNVNNKQLTNFGGVNEMTSTMNHKFYDDDFNNADDMEAIQNGGNDEIADKEAEFEREQQFNNDIFMFLNGQHDLTKFLYWAMEILYPHERFANFTTTSADFYHPGMYVWKKLNLSGHIEPPLFAEEPHYIIVRREEQFGDDFRTKSFYNNDDPFIPPRGRKHNMPDLDKLLHRYETFVPNRGRRDKIKDMLKSNDLFFPNRGKRLKEAEKRDLEYENGNINGNKNSKNDFDVDTNTVDNIENESSFNDVGDGGIYDDWNKTLSLALIVRNTLVKLWQKKLQNRIEKLQNAAVVKTITKNANEINYARDNKENPEWLQAMLNYKFNGYKPTGIKQSMPMVEAINGEIGEISTPIATKNNALMQLMPLQTKLSNDEVHDDDDHHDEIAAGSNNDAASVIRFGVDDNAASFAANRLRSTRSMSTTMAQRQRHQQQLQLQQLQRQQQQQWQHNLQQLKRLTNTMSQKFNGDTEHEQENRNFQHSSANQHTSNYNHHHYQVKPFDNFVPFIWRQLQTQDSNSKINSNSNINTDSKYFQQNHKNPHQPGFWPQEASSYNSLLSKSQRFGLKGAENHANFNDYNYFDI